MAAATPVEVVQVAIGGLAVRRAPALLTTLLGSCVGVVIQDQQRRLGALAHVVRPQGHDSSLGIAYFADQALPQAKDAMLAAGADPRALQVRLAGGSSIHGTDKIDVGAQNVRVLTEATYRLGMIFAGHIPGGRHGTFVILDLSTGRLHLDNLQPGPDAGSHTLARQSLIRDLVRRAQS